jgi:hypothetical protein
LLSSLFITEKDRRNNKFADKVNYRRCHITIPNSQYQGKYYNIDNEGKLGLEFQHLQILKDRIKKTNLIKEVEELIPDMPIRHSQKESYSAFMCNEQVYGTINLIAVYGFLKME